MSLAASPAIALKKGYSAFYFFEKHLVFAFLSLIAMLAVSLLSPRGIRRFSLVLFLAAIAAMAAVLLFGEEVHGAKRWLRFAGFSVQPSELAKPAFVVLSAWAFAETQRRADMPALTIAGTLFALFAGLLMLQPDIGQTILVSLVWGSLYFMSGHAIAGALGLAAAGGAGLVIAYATFGYMRLRIDRFLSPTPGDRSQADRAIQSFSEGGFFGRGPAEGTIKTVLPDAHTDFIFAVVAEEYGVLACLIIVALFATVCLRVMFRIAREPDLFRRYAAGGLVIAFGLQALINMSVNVGLLPAKGMTLPFISSGGSSMLAISITIGMVLALTRRRPSLDRYETSWRAEVRKGSTRCEPTHHDPDVRHAGRGRHRGTFVSRAGTGRGTRPARHTRRPRHRHARRPVRRRLSGSGRVPGAVRDSRQPVAAGGGSHGVTR